MALQSLLLCPDEKTARVLSRVLSELEIGMEQCTEPFDAVKKLMRQRYDAVIVDWENEANATLVLKNARMSPSNKTSLAVAIVEGQTSVRNAFRAGANFVLYKPISLEQAKTSLRAARALMQRGAEAAAKGQIGEADSGPTVIPMPTQSRMAQVTQMPSPAQPFGGPSMTAGDSSWGAGAAAAPAREQGTPIEDLRNIAGSALDSLSPAVESQNAGVMTPSAGGTQVRPFPSTRKDEDEGFYKLDLDADPAAKPERKQTSAKAPEVTAELKSTAAAPRLAAPQVVPKPAAPAEAYPLQTTAEPVKSSFDEVRSRVAAKPFRAAPSAFDTADEEEKSAGFPKPILFGGIGVVAVVVLVFAVMHFRSSPKPQPVAQTVSQQQTVTSPDTTVVAPAPVSAPVNVAPIPQVPALKGEVKSAKEPLPKPSATKPAQQAAEVKSQPADQNSEQEPEVEVHKLTPMAKPASRAEVPDAAPPSMDAVASAANPGEVGGIMQTPVAVPKLVAPDRVRVSQGVSQGMLIHMVKPQYPETARNLRLQGSVVMEALIGKDGAVKNLKVVKGHPVLARAAQDAVRQWRYKPYLLNSQPVDVETQITVNFTP